MKKIRIKNNSADARLTSKIPGLQKFSKFNTEILKEKESRRLQLLQETEEGREEIVKNYSLENYCLIVKNPDPLILELYDLNSAREFNPSRNLPGCTISLTDLPPLRQKQIDLLSKGMNPWLSTRAKLAIAAEMCGEKWARDNGLDVQSISTNDPYNSIDAKIEGVGIDFKAKCGSRVSSELSKKYWDCKEKIILIQASNQSFSDSQVCCMIHGVFDSELIKMHGMEDMLNGFSYFTPPYFMNIEQYFLRNESENVREYSEISIEHFIKRRRYSVLRSAVGGESYFNILAKNMPEIADVCIGISILYSKKVPYLVPLYIFSWLIKKLNTGDVENTAQIKEAVLSCVELNIRQQMYLIAVLNLLPQISKLKCRFTGKLLSEGTIRLKNGVLFVEVESGKLNVLLAYSRLSGEIVHIGSNPVCMDESKENSCACLLSFHKGLYYGKSSCPSFGIERDRKMYTDVNEKFDYKFSDGV